MSLLPDRVISIPGEGLLPPCYEPQIPADIKENERVRVIPPSPPWRPVSSDDIILVMEEKSPQDERYWFFGSAHEEKLPAFDWDFQSESKSKQLGSGNGLSSVPSDTIIRFAAHASEIRLPDLWAPFGGQAMLVSKELLHLMAQYDNAALEYRRVMMRSSDDIEISDYYMVDVINNIHAIDVANSIVDYRGPVRSHPPRLQNYVSSKIRDDLDENFHIFRQKSFSGTGGYMVIVSKAFRDELISATPKFTNIRLDACGGVA